MRRIRPRLPLGPILGALIALCLAGCSDGDPSTTPGEATSPFASNSASSASEEPLEPEVFESSRHGYRVEVPAGWVTNEFDDTWTALDQFSPGAEVPGEDVVATPDRTSFLVMDSMAIPDGTSAKRWLSDFNAVVAAGLPEDCEATTSSGVLAAEPATVVDQVCADSAIRGYSLVHEGRGYYFTALGPADDPDALAVVERLTASIEFVD